MSRSELLQLCTTHVIVLNEGLLGPPICKVSTEQKHCISSLCSEMAAAAGNKTLGTVWWAWGSDSWVPILPLPLTGSEVLGMLFNLLLNLDFFICKTGKVLAPNS